MKLFSSFSMKKLFSISFLINLYFLFLGIAWFSFHFIIRFVLERPTYHFNDLNNMESNSFFLSFLLFNLVQLFLLCLSILLIYKLKHPKTLGKILQKLLNGFQKSMELLYTRPIEYLQSLVFPHIPGSGKFFVFLSDEIWKFKSFFYFY